MYFVNVEASPIAESVGNAVAEVLNGSKPQNMLATVAQGLAQMAQVDYDDSGKLIPPKGDLEGVGKEILERWFGYYVDSIKWQIVPKDWLEKNEDLLEDLGFAVGVILAAELINSGWPGYVDSIGESLNPYLAKFDTSWEELAPKIEIPLPKIDVTQFGGATFTLGGAVKPLGTSNGNPMITVKPGIERPNGNTLELELNVDLDGEGAVNYNREEGMSIQFTTPFGKGSKK